MKNLNTLFVNAILADASYVSRLATATTAQDLQNALKGRMTDSLARYIAVNFEVLDQEDRGDVLGSGFDATVWKGRTGGDYAGQVFVSMRGTVIDQTSIQDLVTDIDLARPFGAGRQQLVDMVNWWNRITTNEGPWGQTPFNKPCYAARLFRL